MSSTSLWIFASPAGGGAELDEVDAAASVAANRRHELVEVADIDCLDAPNGRITFANDLVVIRIEACKANVEKVTMLLRVLKAI